MLALVALVVALIGVSSSAQLPPCSSLLTIDTTSGATTPGEWRVVLRVPISSLPHGAQPAKGWHLRLSFARPVESLEHNVTAAISTTVDDRNFVIRERESLLSDVLAIQLVVLYNDLAGGVELSQVKINNRLICNNTASQNPAPAAIVSLGAEPPCLDLLDGVTAHGKSGEWMATLSVPVPALPHGMLAQGWHLKLTFSHPIQQLSHNASGATMTTVDDKNFIMRSAHDSRMPGQNLVIKLHVLHEAGPWLALDAVKYNNKLVCNGSRLYDYSQALSLTLLFLEAQQSGPLPSDHRVPWRGDSCLGDRGQHGEDLTGGYFTGSLGRTVKFTFPNAAANTMLAWGMIAHKAAYESANELVNGMAAIDWGARYLLRCISDCGEVYAIVGDHLREPSLQVRPESVNYLRPVLALTADNPGSDMFGEIVAALASASVVLRDHWEGPRLANVYLAQARRLFETAAANRGDYLRALQLLTPELVYTPRNGDECELIWAACWMYRSTMEPRYLQLAERFYGKLHFQQRPFTYYYWDDKAVGAMILLYTFTRNVSYAEDARIFCDEVAFNQSRHTSKGLLKGLGNFASGLQLGVWAAFACIQLGETMKQYDDATSNPYLDFSARQVHYVLGDTGPSFLVGFGQRYPLKANDMASMCPPPPANCDRLVAAKNPVNAHLLQGAMVFGPDRDDQYEDSHVGVGNNVDIIGNAGLSSALAALAYLRAMGRLIFDSTSTQELKAEVDLR